MCVIFEKQNSLVKAIQAYDKAVSLKPDYASALAQKLHQKAHICDWSSFEDNRSDLINLGINNDFVSPFTVLSFDDAPNRHRLRSENFARHKFTQKFNLLKPEPAQKSKRLRIGYFSADFHNHATMYLLAEVFKAHDKSKFEIFAFSYGPSNQDEMRKLLFENVDVFHDVRELSDIQFVEIARNEHLDIAVDLKGYTKDKRLEPFAYGLAPIQISYLGYPGTLGADFIDYIVADPIVFEDKASYSEQIISPSMYHE